MRVPVTARINISSPDTQAALNLADLSISGFSLRSREALPVGQVMRFMFAAPTSPWVVSLVGQIRLLPAGCRRPVRCAFASNRIPVHQ